MDWTGPGLFETGFMVCRSCLDKPQQQNRTIILPPDPRPVVNPRPSKDIPGTTFFPLASSGDPASAPNPASTS
jgi:hypothetical protein